MRRKWITKAEERQILRAYERYAGEFQPYEDVEHFYEIPGVRKVTGRIAGIRFEKEPKPMIGKNARIFVHHTDGKGLIMFIDVWERDKDGKLLWKYRNPANLPLSDREVIKEYEREIEYLEELVKKLQGRE